MYFVLLKQDLISTRRLVAVNLKSLALEQNVIEGGLSLARALVINRRFVLFFLLSSDSSLNKSNATILLYSPIDCGPI